MQIEDLKSIVEKNSNYSEDNARGLGEVFTPFSLVSRILDEIPQEYFEDPSKTYFDPCAGKGNFQVPLVERLMEALEYVFPNEEERYRHILENQIFMAEYQEDSCNHIQQTFNPNGNLKLNLYQGSSLDSGVDFLDRRYDVILGNPPFNDSTSTQAITEETTQRRSRGKALHLYFLKRYLDQAQDYFFFIMPSKGWWTGSNHLKSKKIYREKGLYKIFPTQGYFDIVLIKVGVFCFDKKNLRDLEDCFEDENKYQPVENSLSPIYSYSTSTPRNRYEDLLSEEEKKYKVYVTTRITKYTDEESTLNLIDDKDSSYYRVIFNQNTDTKSMGRIKIALPGEYVSGSIVYLKCGSLEEAQQLKEYLETDPVVKEVTEKGRSTHVNSKHFFSLLKSPFYL